MRRAYIRAMLAAGERMLTATTDEADELHFSDIAPRKVALNASFGSAT